ncbi:Pyridoxal phosphate-dependent transferase [Gracilaria domingensis]|nr:Pyridoxal phosphate-dependent transferase [Gracilaria domingensis]
MDRGRHFHLVASGNELATGAPSISSMNGAPTITHQPQPYVDFANPSDPPQQSDAVAFVLRPPTVPKEDCGPLNEAVHMEWLKGRGAAWISGSPELQYSKENGSFHIRVLDLGSPSPDPSATIVTESGLAAALDTLEDAALDECVSRHLTEGGDDRLHLSSAGVNKYYCPPRPLPKEVVIRGSCTCSSPTPDGFEAARRRLRSLWSGRVSFSKSMDNIRYRLSKVLKISVPHEIILHPSGSDAELIPLLIAIERCKQLGCSKVVNIVAAAGEVGSGSAPAAAGRHFSAFTPCGNPVSNGELLDGFPNSTVIVELKPRCSYGKYVDNYDEIVKAVIDEHESAGDRPFFVVHAVDGSKTGLRLPSLNFLAGLKQKLGERVHIVMDACQMRSEPEEIDWFLRRDASVLVTSSKFYSAPGFCGAVVVPSNCVDILKRNAAPVGLRDYLTQYEIPPSITGLHDSLLRYPKNIGLLLRWECGISEMEMFDAMGMSVRHAMRNWVSGVRKLICDRRPALDLIDRDCFESERDETRCGGVNSVVSIKFLAKDGSYLDADVLRRLHRYLTIDASSLLPIGANEEERKVAALQCMVGQPVKLGPYGVLRLAVGAPMARDIAQPGQMEKALKDDEKILEKMIVLGRYYDEMRT